MKIQFLNVGQGDSIILQWVRDEKIKVGIIDCKNNKSPNSTIEQLKAIKPESIDFIILSHPHSDHFSGMEDLLTYLITENIPVHHFYTTATISPNRIMLSVKGKVAKNAVTSLFKMLKDLYTKDLLPMYFMNETDIDMLLNSEWRLKIMSPSTSEIDTYSSTANYNIVRQEEEPDNEPKGNLLSTFLAIHCERSYFLLTSDTVLKTFQRVDKKYRNFFSGKKLLLGQIPHHGSKENYSSTFWKTKNPEKKEMPAVISVGTNGYHHPNKDIMTNLSKLGYEIYKTEDLSNTKESENIRSLLSAISLSSSIVPDKQSPEAEAISFKLTPDTITKL